MGVYSRQSARLGIETAPGTDCDKSTTAYGHTQCMKPGNRCPDVIVFCECRFRQIPKGVFIRPLAKSDMAIYLPRNLEGLLNAHHTAHLAGAWIGEEMRNDLDLDLEPGGKAILLQFTGQDLLCLTWRKCRLW